MSKVLTEKEAETLFAQMSSAIRSDDSEALDKLAMSPQEEEDISTQGEPEVPEKEEVPEKPEEEDKPSKQEEGDDTPAAEVKDDEGKPEKADDKEDKTTEKSDQEKLKEALELIEKVNKENHSLRSQAGRVPHIQRQMQQLDKKLEELEKLATSPSSRPSAKLSEKINQKLAKIREADSELADVLADVLADATDGVAEDMRTAEIESLRAQRKDAAEEYRKVETQRLLDMYPNAREVFQSPSWAEWKSKQSDRILGLAHSDNADDVSFAFQKYAEDMIKQHPELAKKAETPEPAVETKDEEAEKIEAERQRKRETAVVVGNPNAAGRKQTPDDEAALFRKFSEEIRKERTGT